jgi:hypothetical protein
LTKRFDLSLVGIDLIDQTDNYWRAYKLCYKKGYKNDMDIVLRSCLKNRNCMSTIMLFQKYFDLEQQDQNELYFLDTQVYGEELTLKVIKDPRMHSYIKQSSLLLYLHDLYDTSFVIKLISIFEFEDDQYARLSNKAFKSHNCCLLKIINQRINLDTDKIKELINNIGHNSCTDSLLNMYSSMEEVD